MSFGQAARLGFTAVGAYFGGPVGAMVGSAIGGALFPEQLPDINGQKLGDMQMTNSAYGAPIPIVYGTVRIATTILYTSGRKATKHKETEGGKGGPEQTTTYYTYSLDAGFAICEGPITGVKRIWINSRLVFDSGTAETQMNVDTGGGALAKAVTVYTGTEDQQPSAMHEAYEGAGLVPAYRGLAIIEFDDLQLEKFGNGMVNVEVEVTAAGTVLEPMSELIDNPVDGGTIFYDVDSLVIEEGVLMNGVPTADYNATAPGGVYTSYWHHTLRFRDLYGNLLREKRWDMSAPYRGYNDSLPSLSPCRNDPYFVWLGHAGPGYAHGDLYWFKQLEGVGNTYQHGTRSSGTVGCTSLTGPYANWDYSQAGNTIRFGNKYYITHSECYLYNYILVYEQDPLTGAPTTRLKYLFTPADLGLRTESSTHYHIFHDQATDGEYFWMLHDENKSWDYITLYNANFEVVSQWHYDDVEGDSFYSDIDGAGQIACSTDGWIVCPGGQSSLYAQHYKFDDVFTSNSRIFQNKNIYQHSGGANSRFVGLQGTKWVANGEILFTMEDVVSIGSETVANIVEDQCARVGILPAQIDTSGLTKSVAGYFLSQNMSARNALETLQVVGFFDVAEVDGKIVCTERGGASQGVIPQNDLAAVVGGGHRDDFEVMRRGELELPRKVSVSYMNPDDDYLTNTQTAERLTARGEGVQNAQVPIVLQDEDAMTLTDAMLYQHYSERETATFFVSTKHMRIAPNDIWTVGDSGYRIRVETVTQDIVGVLTVKGIIELTSETYTVVRDTAFVSSATPVAGLTGPTVSAFMTLPALRTGDLESNGVYIGGAGVYPAWEGYSLMVSDDNSLYVAVNTVLTAADFFTTTEVLASAGTTTTWDYSNTLNVRPVGDTVLATDTEINVLNGANAAAVGIEGGNWEIIQWVTASAETDGTYTLSKLLRGRKGTEFATDTHITAEDFVLLADDGSVLFNALPVSYVDVSRYWKTVTLGTTELATASDYIADTGRILRPYSPAHLRGTRTGTGSATVNFTWQRRSRYEYNNLWDIAVGEVTEKYEVDFYSSTVFLRTVSTTSKSVAYTSAERVTDGMADPSRDVTSYVFQISDTVGRGDPATATI